MLKIAIGLAYRQLTHRGAKLVGALLGVSVAIVLMFTQLGFQGALYDSAVGTVSKLDGDIILAAPDFQTLAFNPPWIPKHLLYDALGVEGVSASIPFYASTIQLANPGDGKILTTWLFGFPPDQPVFRDADIRTRLDLIRLPEVAIIDANSRNEVGLIAARVAQGGRLDVVMPAAAPTIQPVFRLEGTFHTGPTINVDGNIITSDLNFYRFLSIPLDRVSLGVVKVAPGFDPQAVKEAVLARLQGHAKVFTHDEFVANEKSFYAKKTPIGFIFDAGLAVGVVVGIVFISQVLHGIVSDNMREYATLRAMGYRQDFFIILVGVIAVSISFVTYVPSTCVSFLVYHLAAGATKLPMAMKISYLLEVFVLVVTMGLVATFLSTKKLKQADPVDLF